MLFYTKILADTKGDYMKTLIVIPALNPPLDLIKYIEKIKTIWIRKYFNCR